MATRVRFETLPAQGLASTNGTTVASPPSGTTTAVEVISVSASVQGNPGVGMRTFLVVWST